MHCAVHLQESRQADANRLHHDDRLPDHVIADPVGLSGCCFQEILLRAHGRFHVHVQQGPVVDHDRRRGRLSVFGEPVHQEGRRVGEVRGQAALVSPAELRINHSGESYRLPFFVGASSIALLRRRQPHQRPSRRHGIPTAIPFGRKRMAKTRKGRQKRSRQAVTREGGHAKRNPVPARAGVSDRVGWPNGMAAGCQVGVARGGECQA